ncbi:alpha-glucuronidase family glycosyl hydrolase [Cohnella panacarvi]|uniref:alpha-glucuronidase family glycosyl hydrolase n=1 Tax=Cohnella panacarvi TaxID=400776 RepID=UPI00047CAEF4|nr:alpha-glucuronidase family glycosyl hydrolase [Cohnella panacarvi]
MASKAYKAWLQYERIEQVGIRNAYIKLLGNVVLPSEISEYSPALRELKDACRSMLGIEPLASERPSNPSYTKFGYATGSEREQLRDEGYRIHSVPTDAGTCLSLVAGGPSGLIYGVFHLLRLIGSQASLSDIDIREKPASELRMLNQWDNADGSIERGYAGQSIFYYNDQIASRLDRVRDYARLAASVGINGIAINNVNVHKAETAFITESLLPEVSRVADVFRSYGIRLFLSVNFAAPIQVGGLATADPLDPGVCQWWKQTAKTIYDFIPDFGGFLVKADSEHRPGPFTYGRDHADGANMLADALAPHRGIVIWRCFVYNCMQDWRDRSTDRARAAYDHFTPLDGKFKDNVILQIKNGPMDFQVREPVSPLFGAMTRTNQVMEFQVTQEYTGQQRHLCYLVPQWKEVLEFDTHAKGSGSLVKRVADGSLFGTKHSGYAAVSNIGDDDNWTGHTLAQANLYGYGRLIWNPDLSAERIADEWIRQTFGNEERVVSVISRMLMGSWRTYENYTAPLGVGWMVAPNHHYGPDVDGYEYSRWGTYHFADRDGIGVDRTTGTGTGYSAQYHAPNSAVYNDVTTCPDELLLFFHHVPYTHRLHSGLTVIQHIYDTHFEGAEQANGLLKQWSELEGLIDSARFGPVRERLREQAEHAKHWRDVINTYFYRKSGVPDEKGRTIY